MSAADPVRAASDPSASAWVSANAGSGKTYVLVRRVIRLLLNGTDPARLLCLTFTKAAAAEMSRRVFDELARWTGLSDNDLADAVFEIDGRHPDAAGLAAARHLFARALDTPGGLKIQTIHAFCERLLHQFPFEANVPGRFEVLEDIAARALRDEARRRVWVRAADDPSSPLGQALATVLASASDFVHETSIVEFIEQRDRIRAWIDDAEGFDAAMERLRDALGLEPGETVASVLDGVLADMPFDDAGLVELARAMRLGSKNDAAGVPRVMSVVEASNRQERARAYLAFFQTKEGKMRSGLPVSAKVHGGRPGLKESLEEERERLADLSERLRLAECLASSRAMLLLADGAIAEYEELKRARGVLDFEDLVVRTVRLLVQKDASAWVHYKLDRGLDHILVDEAQDTSPRQWQVIRALAEEFFVGEGARDIVRTLFAVGDEKQSIYSFQGAVPAWFAGMRETMRGRAEAAGLDWHNVPLHVSRRSTPTVLSAVDRVFAPVEAHSGLSRTEGAPIHEAHRRNEPGRVVLWPLALPPDKPEPDDWATPLDHLSEASPELQIARRIADTIRGWLTDREKLDATGKPIRPRDILILTRNRGALSDAINRELKKSDIPIAGTDRLALTEHLAVLDLLALGRVVLLPADDLSLAALLKTPLLGLDEDALFRLAHGRKGSLWRALGERAEAGEAPFAAAHARLQAWRSAAERLGPHAFFARVIAADGGRRAFLARLGAEVDDVLDAFLGLALEYERANLPSLQGFVTWLDSAETEVKRDPDSTRDEVRVMTVHGAKGLEAGIVFLADNGSMPVHSSHYPRLLTLGDPDVVAPAALVWNNGAKALPDRAKRALDAWCDRAREEYRRLLYVALTRARDRLYVCAMVKSLPRNREKDPAADGGWFQLVRDALAHDDNAIRNADGDVIAWEWRSGDRAAEPSSETATQEDIAVDLPDWLNRPAPPPSDAAPVWLAPSTALGPPTAHRQTETAVDPGSSPAVSALDRGRVVHRLLQSLPDRPVETRRDIARAYLAATASAWPEADRDATLEEVLAVLATPGFAPVFAPGSHAEIDLAGRVGGRHVFGRIDRLAVTDERVIVVDFKTNRDVPRTLADIPDAYIAQMALYRSVLRDLYPGRPIVAALLWTALPALTEIPEDVMDRVAAPLMAV